MFNAETSVVIDWLNANAPNIVFYSSAHTKAFVARELGVPLPKIPTEMKDYLLRVGLDKVNWQDVYSQFRRPVILLSQDDKNKLSNIGKEIYRLREERVAFLKRKGYKLRDGESTRSSYWVHESVLDRWNDCDYMLDINNTKYPVDSVLEY